MVQTAVYGGWMWRTWWLVEFAKVSAHVGNHAFCLGTANKSLQHHDIQTLSSDSPDLEAGKLSCISTVLYGGVPNHFPCEGVVVIQENPRHQRPTVTKKTSLRWMIRKFLGPPRWCAAMFDEFGFSWCWHSWCFHTTMMISSPHGFLGEFSGVEIVSEKWWTATQIRSEMKRTLFPDWEGPFSLFSFSMMKLSTSSCP